MSMQQPIPPEENIQPTVVDAPTEGVAAPIEQPAPEPVADGVTPEAVEQAPTDQQAQDQQVIEQVAQGLADEEITASDIMTAVLSETLGLSPAGAQSLFQLLMSELADDVQADATQVEEPVNEVPPTEM